MFNRNTGGILAMILLISILFIVSIDFHGYIYKYHVAPRKEFQITSDGNYKSFPVIYEDIAVWQDYGPTYTTFNIHACNLVTKEKFQITSYGQSQIHPAIYGDIVVWTHDKGDYSDIHGFNLVTREEFQITSDESYQSESAIYGDVVVWHDGRNGNGDIYGYSFSTGEEFQITTDENHQFQPAIYGDIVVWTDWRNDYGDIYGYNLSTKEEFQITSNRSVQNHPAIYGDIVVWIDWRNGNEDIYGCNLSTGEEFQITSNKNHQNYPAIYGDIVAWEDWRNGNEDIYGYNLSTNEEFQITLDENDQIGPAIYKDIIIWVDVENLKADIYGNDFILTYYKAEYSPAYENGYFKINYEGLVLRILYVAENVAILVLSIYFFYNYITKKHRASMFWGLGLLLYGMLLIFGFLFSSFGDLETSTLFGIYYWILVPVIFGTVIVFEMILLIHGVFLLFFSKDSFFRKRTSYLIVLIYFVIGIYSVTRLHDILYLFGFEMALFIVMTQRVLRIPIFLLIAILFFHIYREMDYNDPCKQSSFIVFMAGLLLVLESFFSAYIMYIDFPWTCCVIGQSMELIAWILMVYGMIVRKALVLIWKKRIARVTMQRWKEIK